MIASDLFVKKISKKKKQMSFLPACQSETAGRHAFIGNPFSKPQVWIPAFAGMTTF
jgi:hypothetical protein